MPASLNWPENLQITARLNLIESNLKAGSSLRLALVSDIRQIAIADNTDKILGGSQAAGTDRFGLPLAPLGAWAVGPAFERRGWGPVLAPNGLASRFITNFMAVVTIVQDNMVLITMGWRDMPWAIFHLEGASKPGTRWVLPQRDVGGVGPEGWAKCQERLARFAADVLRAGA